MKRLYNAWSREHAMLHARVEEINDEASGKTRCGNIVLGHVDERYVSGSHSDGLLRSAAAAVSHSLFATVNQLRAN